MPSAAACAYLISQAFDYVHRQPRPVREAELLEAVSDLTVWPDFRHAAMRQPYFLVVDDALDLATAGIHPTAPVSEILLQTLDLVEVPLTDQTLSRLVRRLRPSFSPEEDPIADGLRQGVLFRPRKGHVANRRWLQGARPVELPIWLPPDLSEAVAELLRMRGTPLPAAQVAAALAERFDQSISEVYQAFAEDPGLLFLPGGQLTPYDAVADEIAVLSEGTRTFGDDWVDASETESAVPLRPDLVRRVLSRIPEGGTISTTVILQEILGIEPLSPDWVFVFRQVTAALGLADLVPVGEDRWAPLAAVPDGVLRPLAGSWLPDHRSQPGPSPATAARGSVSGGGLRQDLLSRSVFLTLTPEMIRAGALQDEALRQLLPELPLLQRIRWEGITQELWYNAEWGLLTGLASWFVARGAKVGDQVQIRRTQAGLAGTLRPVLHLAPPAGGHESQTGRFARSRQNRAGGRSILTAITALLDAAGGSLHRDELLELLWAEDPLIQWIHVEPYFRRLTILRLEGERCYLVRQLTGRGSRSTESAAVRAEAASLLRAVPEEVRSFPGLIDLIQQTVSHPRVTGQDEALLIPAAQRGRGPEWDRLMVAHLRYGLSQMLSRPDLEIWLPHVEDLLQEVTFAVERSIATFDPTRGHRLQRVMGLRVRNSIQRALPHLLGPIRLPQHFFDQVYRTILADFGMVLSEESGEEEAEEGPVEPSRVEFWAEVTFESWEEIAEEYELGALRPTWLTMAEEPHPDPDRAAMLALLRAELAEVMAVTLTPRHAEVIRCRFGLNGEGQRTLEEVGRAIGRTRERVRQIEAQVLRRWRRSPQVRRWKRYELHQ